MSFRGRPGTSRMLRLQIVHQCIAQDPGGPENPRAQTLVLVMQHSSTVGSPHALSELRCARVQTQPIRFLSLLQSLGRLKHHSQPLPLLVPQDLEPAARLHIRPDIIVTLPRLARLRPVLALISLAPLARGDTRLSQCLSCTGRVRAICSDAKLGSSTSEVQESNCLI